MVVSSSLCHLCMPIVFSGICIHTRSQEFQAITSMLKLSIGRKMQRSIMDIWRRRPPNKSVLQGIESAFEQYIMIRSLTLIAVQHVTLMSQVVIFSGNSFFFQAVTWAFSLFKEASKLIKPGHVDEMRMRKEKTFQRLRKRWKRIFWSAWENIFHGCVQLWIVIERIMHLSSFLQNISLLPPSINSITKFYKFKEWKTLNSAFVQYWNHCYISAHYIAEIEKMSSGMIGVGRAGIPQGHRTPHVVITCREKIFIYIKSHHLYWAMLIWLLGYRIAKHECMKTDKITGRVNSKTGFHVACMAPPPANANGLRDDLP